MRCELNRKKTDGPASRVCGMDAAGEKQHYMPTSLIGYRQANRFMSDESQPYSIQKMNHSLKLLLSPAALILAVALLICPGCGKKSGAPTTAASMEELNRALTVVMMHAGQRLPTTNEVAAFLERTGKVFPAAPPGKKIILNPTARVFEVVDQ